MSGAFKHFQAASVAPFQDHNHNGGSHREQKNRQFKNRKYCSFAVSTFALVLMFFIAIPLIYFLGPTRRTNEQPVQTTMPTAHYTSTTTTNTISTASTVTTSTTTSIPTTAWITVTNTRSTTSSSTSTTTSTTTSSSTSTTTQTTTSSSTSTTTQTTTTSSSSTTAQTTTTSSTSTSAQRTTTSSSSTITTSSTSTTTQRTTTSSSSTITTSSTSTTTQTTTTSTTTDIPMATTSTIVTDTTSTTTSSSSTTTQTTTTSAQTTSTSGTTTTTKTTSSTTSSATTKTTTISTSTSTTSSTTTTALCPTGYSRSPLGVCVNLQIDFNNCGSFGYVCNPTFISCSAGKCSNEPAVLLLGAIPVATWNFSVSVDDIMVSLSLPVNLTLYGYSTSNITLTTNGVICLGVCATAYTNVALPTTRFGGPTVLGFWDDLQLFPNTSQNIYYNVAGTTPNRTTTFEFYESRYSYPSAYYHFQVLFFENAPGIVKFIYFEISDRGNSSTIGVQSNNSTGPFIQYSYNQENVVYYNKTLTFNTNNNTYSP